MAMRLNEVHPALTHYPLGLFPVAVGIEIAARITGREDLERLGRVAVPVATSAVAITAASGLMAEQQVQGDDEAMSMLSTHRNLNIAAVGATTAMTAYRLVNRRPGWGYLATGIGVVAAMGYSGYLGGRMTYGKGMGVEAADGLRKDQAPPLSPGNFLDSLKLATRQIGKTIGGLFKRITSTSSAPGFGPDERKLQQEIEADNASPGALPLGSSNRPMS